MGELRGGGKVRKLARVEIKNGVAEMIGKEE